MSMPTPPPPTQAGVAKLIAGLIRQGTPPASLILMMRFTPDGKKLLREAAALVDSAELIAPFKADPESWAFLQPFPEEDVLAFARGFIDGAREVVGEPTKQ